jgi:GTP cyclohydrolase II
MAITQSTVLQLAHGDFKVAYHVFEEGDCVSISIGKLTRGVPIVRIHSSCLFGESFHSLDCECAEQLESTLRLVAESGNGVVVYHSAEGRGIGLESKIRALEIQRINKVDTVEAFRIMGLKPDLRNYSVPLSALRDLGLVSTIKVASQNPHKIDALRKDGYTVIDVIHPMIKVTQHNKPELLAKKYKLGYNIQAV